MEWFWDAIVKDLPIDFFEPYSQVLDTSRGIPWAKWFVGGKLNVAHNCVDRHAASHRDKFACDLWEGEDGEKSESFTFGRLHSETNRVANAAANGWGSVGAIASG